MLIVLRAKNNNRLVQLAHRKIKNSYADGFSVSLVKNNITDGMDSPSFISYRGGPGSGPSIFNTDIRFSDQRTGESNPLSVDSPTKFYGTYKPNFEAGKYLKSFAVPYDDNKSVSGVFSRLTNFDINNLISTDGGKLYQNNVYTEGNTFPEMNRSTAFSNDVATFTQEQLIFKEPISQGGQLTDFRKDVDVNRAYAEKSGMLAKAPNYQNTNIDSLKYINYSSPGDKVRNRSNYGNGSGQIVDAINALYMYKATKADETAGKDLVKFRFAVIDPDSPSEKTFIHFRAYFNGSITDNMNSNWNTFKYAGRGEDFFQYGGFSRDISLSFQVVAQSKGELSIMYQKLNYLQSTLAPNFSDAGYMRGNIHQLTVGGYFYEQPGVLTSLSYTMPDDSTWEIGIDTEGGVDNSVSELPHRINVSIGFKPIHNFLPQTIGSPFDSSNPNGILGKEDIKQKFIALQNTSGSLYDLENGISLEAKPIGNLNLQQPTTEGRIQRQSTITIPPSNRRRRNNR
jgi:hypothetical protein